MQNFTGVSNVVSFPRGASVSSESSTYVFESPEKIADNKSRVKLANAILASTSSCTVNELAKILCQNGIDIGQNRLYKKLRAEGYLCSRRNIRNIPTQKAMNRGYFELRETPYTAWNSIPKTNRTVLVTAKGLGHFIGKYLPCDIDAES